MAEASHAVLISPVRKCSSMLMIFMACQFSVLFIDGLLPRNNITLIVEVVQTTLACLSFHYGNQLRDTLIDA